MALANFVHFTRRSVRFGSAQLSRVSIFQLNPPLTSQAKASEARQKRRRRRRVVFAYCTLQLANELLCLLLFISSKSPLIFIRATEEEREREQQSYDYY